MVALAMAMAPRGLACGTSLSVECKRLAMARVLAARMCAVLHKSSVAPLNASRRSYLCHPQLSRTSMQGTWRGHRQKTYLSAAAAVEDPPELTKKRMSRDERATLVKSFVTKYMSENDGDFPTLTAVLKETGGSRNVVKDILTELQTTLKGTTEETMAPGKTGKLENSPKPAASVAAVSESEEEEEEEEVEETEEESEAETKVEAKTDTTTMRNMVGETPGEINTYSDILSRLRSLGTESSRKKEETPAPPAEAVTEEGNAEVKKPSFATRILPPRHGMFVRFLHPSATEEDLRNAFGDCGEITRVSAVKPMKPTAKFTYGFIDFKTADGLSNALRKSVEIRGHKVETEAAPTQNAQISDVVNRPRESQVTGTGLIDNLVSKVVSMVPQNPDSAKGQLPQTPRVWNGQDASRFQQLSGGSNKGQTEFKPKGMNFQRNEPLSRMDLPRTDIQQRNDRNDMRNDMPQRNDRNDVRNEMPPRNETPRFVPPPRSENGGFISPIPELGDPQKLRKDLAVCVENLHPTTNVTQLKDALAIYGEIYGVYLKNRDMSSSAYFFEYLTEEGRENALGAHWLHFNGQMLRISRGDLPKTTVVRVSNISPSTPDSEFINACRSCGQVERVESRRDRVRDVFYHPAEGRNMIKILDRLNEITYNQCRWHAKPAPRCTMNMLNKPEGREFICQQIKVLLRNQENMLQHMQTEQRDLRELSMYAVEMLNSQSRKL